MNYTYRLKCRVREEGFGRTLQYFFAVSCHSIKTIIRDCVLDFLYSGRLLTGNQKSPYKYLGANDTYHTDYSVMPLIFQNFEISPEDVLVDVGCGKGRVINYWLSRNFQNRIYGLELDPDISKRTAAQFSRRNQITILPGDALENLPPDGTVFYFYNPFAEPKVREFEEKLRDLPGGSIRVIYYNPKSIHVFQNGFWNIQHMNFENDLGIKRWGRMNKYHDLCILCKKKENPQNG